MFAFATSSSQTSGKAVVGGGAMVEPRVCGSAMPWVSSLTCSMDLSERLPRSPGAFASWGLRRGAHRACSGGSKCSGRRSLERTHPAGAGRDETQVDGRRAPQVARTESLNCCMSGRIRRTTTRSAIGSARLGLPGTTRAAPYLLLLLR